MRSKHQESKQHNDNALKTSNKINNYQQKDFRNSVVAGCYHQTRYQQPLWKTLLTATTTTTTRNPKSNQIIVFITNYH